MSINEHRFRSISSTSKSEGISNPGRGCAIAPPKGGSVEAQIERSTHIIASRLGCSPATIQKLAGLESTAGSSYSSPPSSSRLAVLNSGRSATTTTSKQQHHQVASTGAVSPQQSGINASRAARQNIEGGNALLLPPLPSHTGYHSASAAAAVPSAVPKQKSKGGLVSSVAPIVVGPLSHPVESGNSPVNNNNGSNNHPMSGLSIAQQQAAFLDDAAAARQFAAQLRFRKAMQSQRKAPGVGQYDVPPITGANRGSVYSRSPHVSLDGQTPRSGRFVLNTDLFENGVKRPGPGEYFCTAAASQYQRTVAGRDRSMRKRTALEKLNPRMIPDMKQMQKYQKKRRNNNTNNSQSPSRGAALNSSPGNSKSNRARVTSFDADDDYY